MTLPVITDDVVSARLRRAETWTGAGGAQRSHQIPATANDKRTEPDDAAAPRANETVTQPSHGQQQKARSPQDGSSGAPRTWTSPSVDDVTDRPTTARIDDFSLGGSHSFAIDRMWLERQLGILPSLHNLARDNRTFRRRVVRHAIEEGIRQFLDIGSGLVSTVSGPAHVVAQEFGADAECRVVYVDHDPLVHAHSDLELKRTGASRTCALLADFRDPTTVWRRALGTGLIDPHEPTCLLLLGLVDLIAPDDRPDVSLAYYKEHLAPGSLLALSHLADLADDPGLREVVEGYADTTTPAYLRDQAQIEEFFSGWPLQPPGLVAAPLWRPGHDDWARTQNHELSHRLVGVARKPGKAHP
jgi:hypothetical protein